MAIISDCNAVFEFSDLLADSNLHLSLKLEEQGFNKLIRFIILRNFFWCLRRYMELNISV